MLNKLKNSKIFFGIFIAISIIVGVVVNAITKNPEVVVISVMVWCAIYALVFRVVYGSNSDEDDDE